MSDLKLLSEKLYLTYAESLPPLDEAGELAKKVPIGFARKNEIVAVSISEGELKALTSKPLEHHASDDLSAIFEMPVSLIVTSQTLLTEFINRAYEMSSGNSLGLLDEVEDPNLESIADELEAVDLLDTDEEAPIVRLINSLLQQAIKEKASDVHIEVYSDSIAVRMRIDGILYTILNPPKRLHPQIVSRIKIMSSLDIAEKRLPQDGRISLKAAGREIDLRVSTIPTAFGERVVMRLLDKSRNLINLSQLGMEPKHLKTIDSFLSLSNGIVLVTGPTGSGKTTTLYSALGEINTAEKNVITVEDPVEYQMRGIGQMQVNPSIDLTFASGLRAILRQDPDVIMVGEIRDTETANIAVQASLTGHLVFSTLHTNDSAGALTRLLDIGVEPYLIASSLEGVLAQRLVRVLCNKCKKEVFDLEGELSKWSYLSGRVYKSSGCSFCMDSGYKGRTGIFEIMVMTEPIRKLLLNDADTTAIMSQAVADGMQTLRDDGMQKVFKGVTALDEVLRVTDENRTEEII